MIQRVLFGVSHRLVQAYFPGFSFGLVGQIHNDVIQLVLVQYSFFMRAEAHA